MTREINQQTSKNKTKDIYSLLGIKLDDESKNAINESVGFSIGKLNEILSAQSQIAQEMVNNGLDHLGNRGVLGNVVADAKVTL